MAWPVVRSSLLHATTFAGGAVAAIAFMASHSVDLYAIYDQLNTVIADISKLIAIVTPIASGVYAAYKATTVQKLKDVAADPAVEKVVAAPVVANAVPSSKVVSNGG